MIFSPIKKNELSAAASRTTPVEFLLALLISLHLVFLPWAWGTMHPWAEFVSLGFSATTFFLGFALNLHPFYASSIRPRWKKLFLFPGFWIGLLFLAFIATQAWNPAWRYIRFDNMFWMIGIEHTSSLPTGMETPFDQMNPFRHLLIWGSGILTMLTICLFASSARLLRLILTILAVNAFVLAAIGFAQILTGAEQLLWTRPSSNPSFLATFIYRNHGAAYFNLMLAVCVGLFLFCRESSWKAIIRRKADASPFFFFAGITILTLVVFSQSRAGATIAVGLGLLALVYTLIHSVRWKRIKETGVIIAIYLLLFGAFAGTFVQVLGWERVTERFSKLITPEGEMNWGVRMKGSAATWEMFTDKPLFGWGAGSFEYYFPVYQAEIPEIHMRGKKRLVWEYAHNDPLQALAEYGIVGTGLIAALFFCALGGILLNGGLRRSIPLWCLIAVLATLAHSNVDFVFHNGAVFITAIALLSIAYRYASLEKMRRAYRPTEVK